MQALSLSFLIAWVYEQAEQSQTSPFVPACSLEHCIVQDNTVLSLQAPSQELPGAGGVLRGLGQHGYHPLVFPSLLPASLRVLEMHWEQRQR